MEPLATVSDLTTRLGIETPVEGTVEHMQLTGLLADASGEIRATIGQPLSRATSTVTLYPDGESGRRSYVDLPAVPVVSMESVLVGGQSVAYSRRYATLELGRVSLDTEITVTYTHGYDPVPEELVKWTCVLAAAQRAAADQSEALGMVAGVLQHTQSIDDYSETWGAAGGGGDGSIGMVLPERVAARLRASYGAGGIEYLRHRG